MVWLQAIISVVAIYAIAYLIIRPILQKRLAPRLSKTSLKGDADTLDFGKDFLFGTATAAWQIEKDVHPSNWSIFEHKDGPDGKPMIPAHGNADEGIERFSEDLELMKSLNVKTYRFSVSWSAINPSKGQFDAAYLQHYVQWCIALHNAGIEPMITLWHFENPSWVEEEGGILAPNFVQYFSEFSNFVLETLKPHCKWFITVNEPEVYPTNGYLTGSFPPFKKSFKLFMETSAQLMTAHAAAYKIIHEKIPGAKASFAAHVIPFYPMHECSVIESFAASTFNLFNTAFLDSIKTGKMEFKLFGITVFSKVIEGLKDSWDYIAVNHYYCAWASLDPRDWGDAKKFMPPPFTANLRHYEGSDFGWVLAPETLAISVRWLNDGWNDKKLPMIITEHGIADANDQKRQWFTLDSLAYLKEAIDKYHVPVIGYTHWSLLDNYEWAAGYTKKFGLVNVDMESQKREVRKSGTLFAKIAAKSK